jgi:hypothetical protein
MKSIVLLVATSLIVATMIAVVPNPIHANSNFVWCYDAGIHCYDNKGECKKALGDGALNTCHKEYLIS